jgi:hypothetical protein
MDGFPGPAGRVGHPDLTQNIGQTHPSWPHPRVTEADATIFCSINTGS